VSNDDQITYAVVGVTALISLVAWLLLIVVPAWNSYWRLRERILAVVMSVYILAAFVGMASYYGRYRIDPARIGDLFGEFASSKLAALDARLDAVGWWDLTEDRVVYAAKHRDAFLALPSIPRLARPRSAT